MTYARLIGVGVGPGDPALITLAAIRALEGADRVVAPVTGDVIGRAEAVVLAALPDLAVERLVFPMSREGADRGVEARAAAQREAARALLAYLDAGEVVAFVTIGDPNCYSTFSSLAAEVRALRPETALSTIPGITAFQALAAASGTVLLDATESLHLLSALDGTDDVATALADGDAAVVVYKGGRHLREITRLVTAAGRLEGAVLGELIGLPGCRVVPLEAAGESEASYLATVIVPPRARGAEAAR